MKHIYHLPAGGNSDKICAAIARLPPETAWTITVDEYKVRRTHDQNAYLWACYRTIAKHLEGWDAEDVHQYFMGECFGRERIEGPGMSLVRPIQRSRELSVEEFSQYIEFVQRKAAELGITIEDPQ